MNIALAAIVILALVLPGIFLSYYYRKGSWKSPVRLGSFPNEAAYGIFWAAVLHLSAIFILDSLGKTIDSESVLELLSGFSTLSPESDLPDSIYAHEFKPILSYLICINIAAFFVGRFAHAVVRFLCLDLIFKTFTFKNEWFYLFESEFFILDTLRNEDTRWKKILDINYKFAMWNKCKAVSNNNLLKKFLWAKSQKQGADYVFISVIVEQAGKSYLYWGCLFEYFFGNDGSLEKIVLIRPQRRLLENDKDGTNDQADPVESHRFYELHGDYLIIFMNDVKNLNIDYKWLVNSEIQETTKSHLPISSKNRSYEFLRPNRKRYRYSARNKNRGTH